MVTGHAGVRGWAARLGAPAAFLAAVTVAVLVVREGLRENDPPAPRQSTAVVSTPGRRFHVVRRGETLAAIAARYDTTVARLRSLNPRLDPNRIQVGLRVRVR